jgi:hypothetical protein
MNHKKLAGAKLLSEVEQMHIYGGTGNTTVEGVDTHLIINIGKGCKAWSDCKTTCQPPIIPSL